MAEEKTKDATVEQQASTDKKERPQGKTVRIAASKTAPTAEEKLAKDTVKITLKRALSNRTKKQIAIAHSLGLKNVGDVTIQPDTAPTRGKIGKIPFLLQVERP